MTKLERDVTLLSAERWWAMAQYAMEAEEVAWRERNMWALLLMWAGAPPVQGQRVKRKSIRA